LCEVKPSLQLHIQRFTWPIDAVFYGSTVCVHTDDDPTIIEERELPLNRDPLDFIERDLTVGAVVNRTSHLPRHRAELSNSCTLMFAISSSGHGKSLLVCSSCSAWPPLGKAGGTILKRRLIML
jgi:hypothetical protein